MRKRLWLLAAGGIVASTVTVAFAMSDHFVSGGATYGVGGYFPACAAQIDAMDPELVDPEATILLQMYGPSGEYLGWIARGEWGDEVQVLLGHEYVGSGTYRCHAVFHQQWYDGQLTQFEDDQMDYYFDMD